MEDRSCFEDTEFMVVKFIMSGLHNESFLVVQNGGYVLRCIRGCDKGS